MKPAPFEYYEALTVEEAVGHLAESGDEAKVLAGGQSLVPLLNFRLARPSVLVDINRVRELGGVELLNGGVAIGATARQEAIRRDSRIAQSCPLLVDAIHLIGHAAIRHRGTVGGSIAHADPAAELPLAAILLDAEVTARSPRGARTLAAADFFVTYLTTALEPDELLTCVWFPSLETGTGWAIQELTRRHGDFAVVSAAATVTLTDGGQIRSARLAVGGAAATPVRVPGAEGLLIGTGGEPAQIEEAVRLVDAVIDPPEDLHGSAEYRRAMARVLARRVLEEALQRARRGGAPA